MRFRTKFMNHRLTLHFETHPGSIKKLNMATNHETGNHVTRRVSNKGVSIVLIIGTCELKYCFIMSVKRNLPAWMLVSDNKSGKDEQISESLKRKPEVNANKRARKKCIKRMMYWMNERELVETALGVLQQDNREPAAADRCAPLNPETTRIPETDPERATDSDVSDPAVDIAEQETVPYREDFERRRCFRASESSSERRLGGSEEEAESEEASSSQRDADHEAMQVLRDIFFT